MDQYQAKMNNLLSNSTRGISRVEFCEGFHVFKCFVIHAMVRKNQQDNIWANEPIHARSVGCIFISVL